MEFRHIYDNVYDDVQQRLGASGGCHDFDHTLRVIRNAMMLCKELPDADRKIVLLAALLHDVARPEEDQSQGAVDHAERGAAMVPEILAPYEMPPEQIAHVADAVRTHRYRDGLRPETLEAEIVYDADKLDSLGAVGIGRAFLFAGKTGARLHNDARTALASAPYSLEDTAYREYLVKLRKLPQAMLTRPGWKMAQSRADFMKRFFTVLNQETDNRSETKMKLECPYCWQHYEIAKSDINRELVCINCEQSFRVQDALIIDSHHRNGNYNKLLIGGLGLIIAILLIMNIWIWQRISSAPKTESKPAVQTAAVQPAPAAAPQTDVQTVIAPLYRTLQECRTENEKLTRQIAVLEQSRQELTERVEKAEKQLAANTGKEQEQAMEEKIRTLSIKITGVSAQTKLQQEYHQQLLNGLTDLRTQFQTMNAADRLTRLESKAEGFDLVPVLRRLDRLEAMVNAMRTVQ